MFHSAQHRGAPAPIPFGPLILGSSLPVLLGLVLAARGRRAAKPDEAPLTGVRGGSGACGRIRLFITVDSGIWGPAVLGTNLDDSRVSRAEALARRLEAQILAGATRPGDRLGTKDELKERFGVAVATVNEAIRLLQARGLVNVRPGPRGGVFASQPSPFVRLGHQVLALKHEAVRVADCLQVRDALDPVIAVEAARHCSASDAAALRERMQRMQAAAGDPGAGDPAALLRANWDLHRRIAEITPNSILRSLYTSLLDATESELTAVIPDSDFPGRVDELLTLHRELVSAIAAGDQQRARLAADRHVMLTNRTPARPPDLTAAGPQS